MINDLAEFITIFINKKHEIIVGIDANEANDQPKNGVKSNSPNLSMLSVNNMVYAKNLILILEDANALNSSNCYHNE